MQALWMGDHRCVLENTGKWDIRPDLQVNKPANLFTIPQRKKKWFWKSEVKVTTPLHNRFAQSDAWISRIACFVELCMANQWDYTFTVTVTVSLNKIVSKPL